MRRDGIHLSMVEQPTTAPEGAADYAAATVVALGRLHAERARSRGPVHSDLAEPLGLGRWEQTALIYDDEVTARRMKRLYLAAFVAAICAGR